MKKLKPIYAPKKAKDILDLINKNIQNLDYNLDIKLALLLKEIRNIKK